MSHALLFVLGFLLGVLYQTKERPHPVNVEVENSCPQLVCPQFPQELPQMPIRLIERFSEKNEELSIDLVKCKEDLGYYLNKAMNPNCPTYHDASEYPD